MLFATEGMAFLAEEWPLDRKWATGERRTDAAGVWMSARVEPPDPGMEEMLSGLDLLHPLGGERRLARFSVSDQEEPWNCPDELPGALTRAGGVRMILSTPGIFDKGWLPGWLDEDLEGSPPGVGVKLRLRSACTDRWKPISGWNLEKRAPKPVRRMVPEGSVYFFEVLSGNPEELSKGWLQSVADQTQDRRDGFALSVWGVWNEEE